MIKITILRKPDGNYKEVRVFGHAESVEMGADLVCCAISTLTINLVNSLEKFADDEVDVIDNDDLGLIQITFMDDKNSDQAKLLCDSYTLGISQIYFGNEYDSWLKVTIKEV